MQSSCRLLPIVGFSSFFNYLNHFLFFYYIMSFYCNTYKRWTIVWLLWIILTKNVSAFSNSDPICNMLRLRNILFSNQIREIRLLSRIQALSSRQWSVCWGWIHLHADSFNPSKPRSKSDGWWPSNCDARIGRRWEQARFYHLCTWRRWCD